MDVQKQTAIVLAWQLYEQGLGKSAIVRRLGRHRETIIEWLKGIAQRHWAGANTNPKMRFACFPGCKLFRALPPSSVPLGFPADETTT